MSNINLAVKNATKIYGRGDQENYVFKNLNLTVEKGTIYGLIGSSGCGKTTLISAIMGMVTLDEGDVVLFGNHLKPNETRSKFWPYIGYMPQEIALIDNMTVKEIILFFGNLYRVPKQTLKERYESTKTLLHLPKDNMTLNECSGGEKRRVSFAAAMIHHPRLLILDEPTVGLDVMLREEIWKFLIEFTRNSDRSVIITTHYTEEAMNSDRVGFMRDGEILIENKPNTILEHFDSNTLEESFYKVSLAGKIIKSIEIDYENDVEEVSEPNKFEDEDHSFSWNIIMTLFMKNYISFKRQPGAICLSFIIPLIISLILKHSIGSHLIGIKIGIVNHETLRCYDIYKNLSCSEEFLSCSFLNEIKEKSAIKVFYDSTEIAMNDAQKVEINGFMEIGENFTRNFRLLNENDDVKSTLNNSDIDIRLDHTSLFISLYLKRDIYKAFFDFSMKYADACNFSKKSFEPPLNLENTLNGKLDDDMFPFYFITSHAQNSFFLSLGFVIAVFISERKDGLWNRTLLTGVRIKYIILSQSIFVMILGILTSFQTATIGYTYDIISIEKSLIFFVILIFLFIQAMPIGFYFGILFDDLTVCCAFMMVLGNILTILSGAVWPIEAINPIFGKISPFISFALPLRSSLNILCKDLSILKPEVYKGILICFAWSVLSIIFTVKIINKKKFSRNS